METIRITGELNAASVPERLRESAGWFAAGDSVTIDLAGATRADSAGVALLVEWLRQARAAHTALQFHNPPPQIRAIIDFSALADVIPIVNEPAADQAKAGCMQ